MGDPWEVLEYIGEALVFIGVVGEVYAEWTEPERKKLGKISSIVLVIGLALSLAALIATNENFNGKIASLNAQAADSNQKAGAAESDAANARKETAQLDKEAQGLRAKADEAELELAKLTGPPYEVPVIRGVATPDLSKGTIQRVLLKAETSIGLPLMPKGASSVTWTLFLTQDSAGGHNFKISWMPTWNENLVAEPNSQWTAEFVTNANGVTVQKGIAGYDAHPMKTAK